jgi:hypothetical protein
MRAIVCHEVFLSYPDFNKPFHIHTDASHYQLGAVISQNNCPIAFYSRKKLQPAQVRYTTTERELLLIVETLKEFRNILLGQQMVVHTDHQNLTHKNFNTERVMRWRLIIEEFGPTMEYIKCPKNIVADTLSRIEMTSDTESLDMADCYGLDTDDLPDNAFPISYTLLDHEKKKDKTLLKRAQSMTRAYSLKKFHGGGTTVRLLCFKDKTVVPTSLTKQIVQWYPYLLCHHGINRKEETIGQHFYWPKMRERITNDVSTCAICQTQSKKYGLLPEKEAEANNFRMITGMVDMAPLTIWLF